MTSPLRFTGGWLQLIVDRFMACGALPILHFPGAVVVSGSPTRVSSPLDRFASPVALGKYTNHATFFVPPGGNRCRRTKSS